MRVQVMPDGPYRVTGSVPMATQSIGGDAIGQSVEWVRGDDLPVGESYDLCRCGRSGNKPYCDGSHERVGFDGTETASRRPYAGRARAESGPAGTLTDDPSLCAFARFCDADGQVWKLLRIPGEDDLVERQATRCPSGRLVAWAGASPLEPELPPSIAIVEDPVMGIAGPIWVRGGIPVTSADGTDYEVRNRVTLCRCGGSRNKPFCDGTHASVRFSARDRSMPVQRG